MNEYHEKFQQLQEKNTFKGQQWFGERQGLVKEYSWAVPNEDALVYLTEFDFLHEAGAGSGYWAHLLQERGVAVDPFDEDPPQDTYTFVAEHGVEFVAEELRDNPVLMVWPPYADSMAADVLSYKPSHVLYVGEPRGGCTASEAFFHKIEQEYGLVAKVDIPSYEGIHDDLLHYTRKI